MNSDIETVLRRYRYDGTRLIDILWDVQHLYGHIPDELLPRIATGLNRSPMDIVETASFYHFFHSKPSGRHRIYLSNTVIAKINGYQAVYDTLEQEAGVRFGETDEAGMFGLFETPCIGLSDQEPAMMIDSVVFTRLTPESVADIIAQLKTGRAAADIANPTGLPDDGIACVDALVESNVHTRGPVFFRGHTDYKALLKNCLASTPEQTIGTVTESGLHGYGGAGFRTGPKWRLCRGPPRATTNTSSATPMRVNSARSRVTSFTTERAAPKMDFSFTSHAISVPAIMATCQQRFQCLPVVHVLAIRGFEFELEIGLTRAAQRNLDDATAYLSSLSSPREH